MITTKIIADSIANKVRLTTMELWRDIPNLEGYYQISTFGNVKSCDRTIRHTQEQHTRQWKGKLLNYSFVGKGYPSVCLSVKGKVVRFYIHRLVATTFIPNPENKKQVNHIDGNKLNNHISNLEWCTNQENSKHAYYTGLSDVPKKLNKEQVEEIQLLINKGISQRDIGKRFGVSQAQVSNIKRGVSWNGN